MISIKEMGKTVPLLVNRTQLPKEYARRPRLAERRSNADGGCRAVGTADKTAPLFERWRVRGRFERDNKSGALSSFTSRYGGAQKRFWFLLSRLTKGTACHGMSGKRKIRCNLNVPLLKIEMPLLGHCRIPPRNHTLRTPKRKPKAVVPMSLDSS